MTRDDALHRVKGYLTDYLPSDCVGEIDEIIEALSVEPRSEKPKTEPSQKKGKWLMPQQDDGMSEPIYYQVRCSECSFDIDPQTWHQELHQYGADKYCPNCGAKMESERKR